LCHPGCTQRRSLQFVGSHHQGWHVVPVADQGGRSKVTWTFDCRVKYVPLGWLIGQTLMKMMMGKIIDGNLKGLAGRVLAGRPS